jgi:hypothetical protein
MVQFHRLQREERVDVRIAAVDKWAALHHQALQPSRNIAECARPGLDQVLVGLVGEALDEGGPLDGTQLAADADLLQVVDHPVAASNCFAWTGS